MFVFINGSFGIGKTTAAQMLRREIDGMAISDPEHVGYVLRRLPAWMLGLSAQPADYQDMALWRRLIVHQARFAHAHARHVLIPMAFTNLAYLDAFAAALETRATVKRVCLVAPLDQIEARLLDRAAREGRAGLTGFEKQRSAECITAHRDPGFGIPIDATGTPDAVTAAIRWAIAL